MLRRPKHGYYFVLESAGSMARKGREPAEAALLTMAIYELFGPTLSTMAGLKFFPKIVNTAEDTVPYGKRYPFVELGLA
jgi:hypothetical protein